MDITTPRLLLIPATCELIEAVLDDQRASEVVLQNVTVPASWPGTQEALDGLRIHLAELRADPAQLAWRIRLIVLRDTRLAIGSVNLKGPPRNETVEIGWGLVASARGHGYTREAAAAVVGWLTLQPEVSRIIATIDDANAPSIRIAEHLGMTRTEERRRGLPVHAIAVP
ncbi:MAG TPA: GNAT family N-acetyltransferase [Kofleriaceae bacterium]|jgi:RimJ/RimL family protein N-acetyltransferase|nr:GNAT family N-acetyltransferase [Kofleriaceae bacterium]